MNHDHIVMPHRRIAARVVDGQALILDPKTDGLQRLNEVGSFIWSLIAERRHTPLDIEKAVVETFDVVEEHASRDVRQFLGALANRELIQYDAN